MVDAVAAALVGIRGAKSSAKVSMRAELSRVEITGPEALVRAAELAAADLRATGKITGDLVFTVDDSASEISVRPSWPRSPLRASGRAESPHMRGLRPLTADASAKTGGVGYEVGQLAALEARNLALMRPAVRSG